MKFQKTDFKSIGLLENSKSKMFTQLEDLTSSRDLYFLLNNESRVTFFKKYYSTKEDIDILISVIFKKSEKAELNKQFEELFFLYFYLILIIKYSIEFKKINKTTLSMLNLNTLVLKTNELATFLEKTEKLKNIISEFKELEEFLSLNKKDSVIIEIKKSKLKFRIIKDN